MEPDWQPLLGQPAWQTQGGYARQIGTHRVEIDQVHCQRVFDHFAQCEGGAGRYGTGQNVANFKRPVKVLANQAADFQRLQVIGVVVAGTQGIGAEHDPPFDFGTEALAPALTIHPHQRGIEPVEPRIVTFFSEFLPLGGQVGSDFGHVGAVAIMGTVVTGKVTRGFAGGDHIIGRHRVAAMG